MKKVVLITGASGAIGSAVAARFLDQEPETQLRLLLRADSPEHLESRAAELRAFWTGPDGKPDIGPRMEFLAGDVSRESLGLDGRTYGRLAEKCTNIVHCAGNVRMNLPLADARRAAVESLKHVMGFAHACRRQGGGAKLEYVSTVGVAGRQQGLLAEDWVTGRREFHNTYEQAKAEAEAVVAAEMGRGMPVTVHRPSMVVGETGTGKIVHFQIFYYLCELLSGKVTFGISPNLKGCRLDIVPADYVARAIVWSTGTTAAGGRILHLCSGPEHSIDLAMLRGRVRAVFKTAGERLPPLVPVPAALFRTGFQALRFVAPSRIRGRVKALPVFLDYLKERMLFANSRTRALLEPAGIRLPAPESYLNPVMEYYLSRR